MFKNTMGAEYLSILITGEQAAQIAQELYGLRGTIAALPGELDLNFRIITDAGSYVLKVSRPESDIEQIEFQQELLNHMTNNSNGLESPKVIPDLRGNQLSEITDDSGHTRKVRLLSWIDGRLWSSVNPRSNRLLFSLGAVAGSLTKVLQGFDHPKARRYFECCSSNRRGLSHSIPPAGKGAGIPLQPGGHASGDQCD